MRTRSSRDALPLVPLYLEHEECPFRLCSIDKIASFSSISMSGIGVYDPGFTPLCSAFISYWTRIDVNDCYLSTSIVFAFIYVVQQVTYRPRERKPKRDQALFAGGNAILPRSSRDASHPIPLHLGRRSCSVSRENT